MHKKRKLSMIMACIIILVQFHTIAWAEDVSNKLLDMEVEVRQSGSVVEEENWDSLDIEEDVELSLSFRVPVEGDGEFTEEQIVNHHDTASFVIAKGFALQSGAGPFDLSFGGKKVGTLLIHSDAPTKVVTAKIAFNGAAEVFTGDWSDVQIQFQANLHYDRTGNSVDGGSYEVIFLDKTFQMNVPSLPTVITGNKSGTRNGQLIQWVVNVKAMKGDVLTDLEGHTFQDNLTNVGSYVPGSFKIGTTNDILSATPVLPDFTEETEKLLYTFPDGSDVEQFLFFQTKINDNVFMSNGNKTITNTAELFLGETQQWTDSASVTFTVEWIKKTGAISVFDPVTKNGEITWTITANQLGASLTNAVITDVLNGKLEFVSAKWSKYIENAWVVQGPIIPTEDSSKYSLGNINTPVQLTIKTKVKADYNIGHTIQEISNSATIDWDELDGAGVSVDPVNVNIGLNPINKTVGAYDKSAHTIPWNVQIYQSDVSLDLRVIDLLVYANSGFNVNDIDTVYTIEDNAGAGLTQIATGDFKSLVASYNQKYKVGSFASGSGLVLKVYTVKNTSGVAVADLLVVTDAGTSGIDVSAGTKSFSYESIVTNPDVYAKNGSTSIRNYATLFSANTRLNQDDASVNYASQFLKKDMLTYTNATDPIANKNSSAANQTQGFNYEDKSVVYRLHINSNQLTDVTNDITTIAGTTLGNVTLSDVLPNGWEFVDFEEDKKFYIFEGTGNANGTVTAGIVPADTSFLSADFSQSGKVDFTFTALTKPYVIVLKAKPNEETIRNYFDANENTTLRNNTTVKAVNWLNGSSSYQDVTISSTVLSKTFLQTSGLLTWTVDYKPYEIGREGIRIEDTIPEGIELRTDAEGNLVLIDNNIVITKLELNANGTYTANGNVEISLGAEGNLNYNPVTRVLTFRIPEDGSDSGYRLQYKTDIIGDPGTAISNQVKLIGEGVSSNPVQSAYTVQAADASATMTRVGWIEITKINGVDQTLLSGAKFEIRTLTGKVFRSGETGINGKLVLRGLPVGNYVLVETQAPDDYNLENNSYSISVSQEAGVFATSIDGKTGVGSNTISIENIKTGTVGSVKITKILSGNATDTNKEFNFTIELVGLNGSYDYVGYGNKANGSLLFVDGVASFSLKGGESITILKLPKDVSYTVAEANYVGDGYTTSAIGDEGTILADQQVDVKFTNTRSVQVDPEQPIVTPPVPEDPKVPEKEETETPEEPNLPSAPIIIPLQPELPTEYLIYVVDGDVDEIKVIEQPKNGTIIINEDHQIIFIPNDSYTGEDKAILIVVIDGEEYTIEIDLIDEEIAEDIAVGIIPDPVIDLLTEPAESLPDTGGTPATSYRLLGALFIVIGVILRRKR